MSFFFSSKYFLVSFSFNLFAVCTKCYINISLLICNWIFVESKLRTWTEKSVYLSLSGMALTDLLHVCVQDISRAIHSSWVIVSCTWRLPMRNCCSWPMRESLVWTRRARCGSSTMTLRMRKRGSRRRSRLCRRPTSDMIWRAYDCCSPSIRLWLAVFFDSRVVCDKSTATTMTWKCVLKQPFNTWTAVYVYKMLTYTYWTSMTVAHHVLLCTLVVTCHVTAPSKLSILSSDVKDVLTRLPCSAVDLHTIRFVMPRITEKELHGINHC